MMISGLIVAHNEEEMIEKALQSLSFCDEIVVCLHQCTDGTKKIAEKYADKILEGGEKEEWFKEGKRRMAGIEACKGEWVLELDADERISEELALEISQKVKKASAGYFMLPVDNYIGQRLVKYGWAGSFGTTSVARLFKKGCKFWGDERVHPNVELSGLRQHMENPIVHLVDKDINDMLNRLQRYSDDRALDMATRQLPPFRNTLRKALTRFYKSYLGRKGYKEGSMGFLLATCAALFMILSHMKAVEIQSNEEASS